MRSRFLVLTLLMVLGGLALPQAGLSDEIGNVCHGAYVAHSAHKSVHVERQLDAKVSGQYPDSTWVRFRLEYDLNRCSQDWRMGVRAWIQDANSDQSDALDVHVLRDRGGEFGFVYPFRSTGKVRGQWSDWYEYLIDNGAGIPIGFYVAGKRYGWETRRRPTSPTSRGPTTAATGTSTIPRPPSLVIDTTTV